MSVDWQNIAGSVKTCLIIDKMHDSIVPLLAQIGYEGHYRPTITRAEVLATIADYDGLIVRSKIAIDRELIDQAQKLKFVGRAGAGLDQLDLAALEARSITVLNAPEGNQDALAEHAVGMLLTLLNKIHLADRQIRAGVWDREANRGVELMGKTVGLIGYGYMGQAFAQRLSGFGVTVLAYDKYRQNYGDAYAQEATMEQLYEQTDVLSLHVPLTEETQNMVDKMYLERFRKSLFLVNTARGKIVTFETLVQALRSGKLLGAALDVLENEKLAQLNDQQRTLFDKLTHTDSISERVVFTPHVAGWTYESYEKINQVLVDKIKNLNLA